MMVLDLHQLIVNLKKKIKHSSYPEINTINRKSNHFQSLLMNFTRSNQSTKLWLLCKIHACDSALHYSSGHKSAKKEQPHVDPPPSNNASISTSSTCNCTLVPRNWPTIADSIKRCIL